MPSMPSVCPWTVPGNGAGRRGAGSENRTIDRAGAGRSTEISTDVGGSGCEMTGTVSGTGIWTFVGTDGRVTGTGIVSGSATGTAMRSGTGTATGAEMENSTGIETGAGIWISPHRRCRGLETRLLCEL